MSQSAAGVQAQATPEIDFTGGFDYSTTQKIVLEYAVFLTAPLSVLGSALIMYVILYERTLLAKSVYHRIMLGMSILDFLCSTGVMVLGPWAVPREVDFVVNARGTFATCAASGFFLNLIFGTMFYSATLALYFLLLIRLEMREAWIARYVEPVGHVLAIGYPVSFGVAGIAYEIINPMPVLPGWCWFQPYPFNCLSDDNVKCIRGGDVPLVMRHMIGNVYLYALLFVIIAGSMVGIILKVRATERRIQRYASGSSSGAQEFERTKEVARQAFLYITAFLLTYFPIAGSQLSQNTATHFAFAFLVKTLSVSQGFFNCIIFLRNQYRALTAQVGQNVDTAIGNGLVEYGARLTLCLRACVCAPPVY